MATSVISIYLDLSDESVGSSILRVILISVISIEVSVESEVGAAIVALPIEVLEHDTHSSLEPDPSESSLPLVLIAPVVSPFLCSEYSKSDTKMAERHVLEKQLLSISLMICLGKHDCVERIPAVGLMYSSVINSWCSNNIKMNLSTIRGLGSKTNPTSNIFDETIANPNAQIVGDDMVRVQVPRCMAWLDYDEHLDSLSMMDNEVGLTSPESTTQTLPSFEEYTPPVTYPEELEKTLGSG
nr:hypothetical protein [Tanacetum cinerariifolium]